MAIVLLAALPASPAIAGNAATPLAALQARGDVIRGAFTQEKYLAGLTRPLVSTGRFVVARQQGLVWQVQQPLATTLVIGRNQLLQMNNGQETLRLSADRQPGLRVVAALLLAVFQADVDRLRHFFTVTAASSANGGWTLELKPRLPSVSKFVTAIHAAGGAEIKRIEIHQVGGDRSVIHLHDSAPDPAGLSAREQAEFSD